MLVELAPIKVVGGEVLPPSDVEIIIGEAEDSVSSKEEGLYVSAIVGGLVWVGANVGCA